METTDKTVPSTSTPNKSNGKQDSVEKPTARDILRKIAEQKFQTRVAIDEVDTELNELRSLIRAVDPDYRTTSELTIIELREKLRSVDDRHDENKAKAVVVSSLSGFLVGLFTGALAGAAEPPKPLSRGEALVRLLLG